jgi:peptide/nickel transport system substrate-binding protein
VPTGPWFAAMRAGEFNVVHYPICHSVVNPLLDVQTYLPDSQENMGGAPDAKTTELYNKLLHEPDPAKQHAEMVDFEKYVMDTQAHATKVIWWNRIVPYRSYVKGFKISPSHYVNMDLATLWLDK